MRPTCTNLFVCALGLSMVCLSQEAIARSYSGAPAGAVQSIAEVHESAEIGERVMVEGQVVYTRRGKFFEIEDDSGKMMLLIESTEITNFGEPELYERIRVEGSYDHAHLHKQNRGIRVRNIVRNLPEPKAAAQVAPQPARETGPGDADVSFPSALPAPQVGQSVETSLTEETRSVLRNARRRVLAARDELKAADMEYGKALGREESDPKVMAEISERQNLAMAELSGAMQAIPGVVEAARKGGVSEESLKLYQEMVYTQ
jgi:uncharacterized protein YdeI (BOF family)